MTFEFQGKLDEAITKIASSYARRCPWTDRDDLINEGWACCLETLEVFPEAPLPYLRQVVVRQLYGYVWQQSSPVKLNLSYLPESAIALRYSALGHNDEDPTSRLRQFMVEPEAEDRAHAHSWREAMHRRIAQVAARLPATAPAVRDAAARVVQEQSTVEAESARTGYAVPTIKAAASRVRVRLRMDRAALQLRACF